MSTLADAPSTERQVAGQVLFHTSCGGDCPGHGKSLGPAGLPDEVIAWRSSRATRKLNAAGQPGLMIAMAFGLVGKGSQTFLSLKAVRSYARWELYAHPTWVAQIVRHHVGGG